MTQLFNSAKDNARPQNSFKDKNLKQESLLCFQFIQTLNLIFRIILLYKTSILRIYLKC